MDFHPYVVVLTLSFLATLAVFILAWGRSAPGSRPLKVMLAELLVWGGFYTLAWVTPSFEQKVLFIKLMFLGLAPVPGLFLLFTLRITRRDDWITPRNLVLLFIEPVAAVLMVWFAPNQFFASIIPAVRDGYTVVQIQRGIGFWINTIYAYSVILLAFALIIKSYRAANPYFKKQYLLVLIGSLIPFAFSLYSQLNDLRSNNMDLAPVAFGITGMIYAFAIFRYRLMALVPVARSRLIENMSDGVLVVDAGGLIVDINKAMRAYLPDEKGPYIGRQVADLLRDWNEQTLQLFASDDTRTELRLPQDPSRYLDLRVTPLFDDKNQLSGRLIVFRDVTDRKTVEKNLRNAMDKLQSQLAEIHALQEQLREQAVRDPLTNLFNRRYLEETLDRELARASRESYPLCVVMMDIDHFKVVNDTYGHEAGDLVLKELALILCKQSRQGDMVCRYGGEELLLVMPNINLETARDRAKVMLGAIEAMKVPFGRFTLSITVSVGISWFPADGSTRADLLRAADRALYGAKDAGRNKVLLYRELQAE